MKVWLKGNEMLEVLLELCRIYQLVTPSVKLERFKDFDMWIVTIDRDKVTKNIVEYLEISRYNYNILRIEENGT